MTRKTFQALADAVASCESLSGAQRYEVANNLARVCKAQNPRFDRGRFMDACLAGSSVRILPPLETAKG